MNSNSVRKKSINLFLLIFILILIIILIFIGIKLLKKDNDPNENETDNADDVSITLAVNAENETSYNPIENLDDFESIDSSTNSISEEVSSTEENNNNTTIEPSPTANKENTVTLSNHTYSLPSSLKFSKISDGSNSDYLLLQYPDFEFEMTYNTYNLSFESLKSQSTLRSYIENTFGISISGDLKTGNVKKLDIIACSISENSKTGYFIITPLNGSEIIYTKIFNTTDSSKLVPDLSNPLDQIISMKSYLKN